MHKRIFVNAQKHLPCISAMDTIGGMQETDSKTEVGRVLSVLMRAHGIGPTTLARATKVGQSTISRILSGGIRDPKDSQVAPLASFFGESTEALRGREPLATVRDGMLIEKEKPAAEPIEITLNIHQLIGAAMDGMTPTQVLQWLASAEQIKSGAATREDLPPDPGSAWADAVQAAEAGVYQILAEAGVEESKAPQVSARILAFMERRIHNQGAPPGQPDRRHAKS